MSAFLIAAVMVVITALLGYFWGCLNGSVMVSHFIIKDDVRQHGSGNAGLTNFYRTYGAKYALGVILFDMGKTVAACALGGFLLDHALGDWTLGVLVGGLGCELGHMFPVFFGFKGGKGILSGGTLVWLLTKYVSLGSVSASLSLPVTTWLFCGHNVVYTALTLVIAALVVWCHRENIRRLVRGEERKFRWHTGPVKDE